MARQFMYGAELGAYHTTESQGFSTSTNGFADGRTHVSRGSSSYRATNASSQIQYRCWVMDGESRPTIWLRLYVRMVRYATNGQETRLFGIRGNIEGVDDAVIVNVGAGGAVQVYNKGNGATLALLATPPVLPLGEWHCLELRVAFNQQADYRHDTAHLHCDLTHIPPIHVADTTHAYGGSAMFWFDGVVQLCGIDLVVRTELITGRAGDYLDPTSPPPAHGMDYLEQTRIANVGTSVVESGDAWYDIDDVIIDDAGAIGPGSCVLPLAIEGLGADVNTGWVSYDDTSLVPGGLSEVPFDIWNITGVHAMKASRPARVGFAMQSWTRAHIVGAIRALTIVAQANTNNVGTGRFFVRKNGQYYYSPYIPSFGSWTGSTYMWRAEELGGISVSDDLQIGLVKEDSAVTTNIATLAVTVEVYQPDVEPAPHGDIRANYGHYVGNGTSQDIDVGFEPQLVFVMGHESGQEMMMKWPTGWEALSPFAPGFDAGSLLQVRPTGFRVAGSTAGVDREVNAVGKTYSWYAMADPFRRVFSGAFTPVASDNFTVPFPDPTFTPEVLFAASRARTSDGVMVMRGPAQSGDAAVYLSQLTAEVPDAIQSMGTGAWQAGGLLTGGRVLEFFGLRTTAFANTPLIAVQTYVGDGSVNRRILSGFPQQSALVLLLVVPSTNAQRILCHANLAALHVCQGVPNGTIYTGSQNVIPVFDSTGFAVRGPGFVGDLSGLNTLGVTYTVLSFAIGIDPPEAVIPQFDSPVALSWVELTDSAEATHYWSTVALPDPDSYYGGFKDPRVLELGPVRRGLSDFFGAIEASEFTFVLDDDDRLLRGLLAEASTRYFRGRQVVMRTITDGLRRQLKEPRTMVRGVVKVYKPTGGLQFSFTVQDYFADKFKLT